MCFFSDEPYASGSNTLWAMARLVFLHPTFLQQLSEQILSQLETFGPQAQGQESGSVGPAKCI